ncbi:MAG TPA: hypothetical protein VHP13_08890 [Gammaproteobacteria bacterium]|jgi:hypothetical protein|nr:hypothetical protein [Gammaproteobacteria bacterium]
MRPKTLAFLLALLAFGTVQAADKPRDVRDVMTASQFHATGLDKLSPQELAAFNAWLAGYTHAPSATTANAPAAMAAPMPASPAAPTPAPAAASTGSFGKEMLSSEQRGEPARIESRIVGTFTGWNGRTLFKLENGQVWKQADGSYYETRLENPPVVIKRMSFGYLLSLTGHGATVFVTRVQ